MASPRSRAAPRGLPSPPIREHVCPDGLTVLVAEDHALPLITVEIAAKNGSMTESPEYSGLSHPYEHLFFKAGNVLPAHPSARPGDVEARAADDLHTDPRARLKTQTCSH